jgi:hypothetical protein
MNRRKLPLGFARSVRVFYSDEALFFFRYEFTSSSLFVRRAKPPTIY